MTDAEKCSLVKRLLCDVIDQDEIALRNDPEDFVNQWNKLQTLQFPHTINLSMPHSGVIGVPPKDVGRSRVGCVGVRAQLHRDQVCKCERESQKTRETNGKR